MKSEAEIQKEWDEHVKLSYSIKNGNEGNCPNCPCDIKNCHCNWGYCIEKCCICKKE